MKAVRVESGSDDMPGQLCQLALLKPIVVSDIGMKYPSKYGRNTSVGASEVDMTSVSCMSRPGAMRPSRITYPNPGSITLSKNPLTTAGASPYQMGKMKMTRSARRSMF